MSPTPPIPQELARAVRAVYASSNFYVRVGDQLGAILAGLHVTDLLAVERPTTTEVPILALTTYFQYAEGLSDMQAVDALRHRQEWKYALHLPVIAPTVHENALCRYRQGLWIDPVAQRVMGLLVSRLQTLAPGMPRKPDLCEMLSSICSLNRLTWLYAAMDSALEMLARHHLEKLGEIARPYWYTLYRAAAPEAGSLANKETAAALSLRIGADIDYLLQRITADGSVELANQPELVALSTVWGEQFGQHDAGQMELRPFCSFCAARNPANDSGYIPDLGAGGGDDR